MNSKVAYGAIAVLIVLGLGLLIAADTFFTPQINPELVERERQLAEQEKNPQPQENDPVPPTLKGKATLEPGRVVTVKTTRGTFRFVLFERDMPATCENFTKLVSKGFYNGLKFHRVESWVVQGGDPKGDGTGGLKECVKLETKEGLGFGAPYMVGMARSDDPNSASCQWFVTKQPAPRISPAYACFGRVIEGEDVINQTRIGDKMKQVTMAPPTPKDIETLKQAEAKLTCASPQLQEPKRPGMPKPQTAPQPQPEHKH